MKKLLSLIGTVSIIGAGVSTVISCNDNTSVDQQTANDIRNKITNPNLTVPAGTNPDTTNTATIAAMKKALQKANPTLSNDNLSTITFASATLTAGTPVTVVATITVGTATAKKDLYVTLAQSDQQKANAIKDKIKQVDLTVAGVAPGTQNEATIKAIKTALKSKNPTLTTDDLTKITFNTVNLKLGEAVTVKAMITVGTAKAEKNLNVTLANTDQQKADAIKSKITTTDLNLPVGTSTDVSQDKTALDKALQSANPTLTPQDLTTITYTGPTLIPGSAVNVIATITVGSASDSVTLKVTLNKKTPPLPGNKVLSGYWYGWNNPVAISAINSLYNLIDIAFYNAPSPDSSLPALDPNIINNEAAVKAGIKKQQADGHKVILSLGGQNDFTAINASNVKQFESNTLTIIKNYGFNGMDIDLEGGPASNKSNAQYIPEALKYLKMQLGSNFIITAAPEFPKLRTISYSIYPSLLKSLGNDLTYLQPQIYNQNGDGINVSSSDQAKFGVPAWLPENNTQFHAQFLYLIMKYLSNTDPSDPNFAVKVDPAKLLIGLPASKEAAGSGYTEPAVVQKAYQIFQTEKLNISGLMTWAVNYDNNHNWQFAKDSYGKTWGQ